MRLQKIFYFFYFSTDNEAYNNNTERLLKFFLFSSFFDRFLLFSPPFIRIKKRKTIDNLSTASRFSYFLFIKPKRIIISNFAVVINTYFRPLFNVTIRIKVKCIFLYIDLITCIRFIRMVKQHAITE